jgi:hypothetical protein
MNTRLGNGLRALLALMALGSGLAGCSDLGEPIKLTPRAEVSATALDFGTVAVSASASRSVVVSNSGTGTLNGFASVRCPVYSIQSGGGSFTVAPGGEHTVVVVYAPTTTGQSPCQLLLGGDIPPVDLNGEGALQAAGSQCVLSDTTLDFGSGAVGGAKQDGFTITNPGTAPLILNVVPTCGDFTITTGGGPSTLEPGGSLPVGVQFIPSAGGQISCTIAVGPGCPEVRVHGFATSVSFASDIRPILTGFTSANPCGFCHSWPTTSSIVNVPGSFYPAHVLVKPGDPANSLIYIKIVGTPPSGLGARMPQSFPPLTAVQIDKFRRWILEGALNN